MPMPLPQHSPSDLDRHLPARSDDSHHFDSVHGDVAALHARIEQSFARLSDLGPAPSLLGDRIETAIQAASRCAGYVAFAGALGGIAWLLF